MIILIKDDDGQTLGRLLADDKTFSSGSRGFFGSSKVELNGKRYQVQFQAVEIGGNKKGDTAA